MCLLLYLCNVNTFFHQLTINRCARLNISSTLNYLYSCKPHRLLYMLNVVPLQIQYFYKKSVLFFFRIIRRIIGHYFPKHRNFGLCDTWCLLAGRNWTFSVI